MPGSRDDEFGSDRIRQRNEQGLMATRQAEGCAVMLHLCSELHKVPQFPHLCYLGTPSSHTESRRC